MKTLLAIDPGANGGLAWRDSEGIVQAQTMPDGLTAQCDRLRELACELRGVEAILERVGTYMPGNAGPSAATFARHCGNLEAALYCLGIPTSQVSPQTWQKATGTWPKEKPQRKRAIRDAMQRLHPHLRVTLDTADAPGILAWGEAGK